MLTIGDKFPEFGLVAVKGGTDGLRGPSELAEKNNESSFTTISLGTHAGKWRIIFFWPKNFTFVCPTEIRSYNSIYDDFTSRGAVLYGVSTDSEYSHLYWRMHDLEMRNVRFPMISDIGHNLSKELGIYAEKDGVALRATFIIDPTNTIRWINVHDILVGRNPRDALRVLDALMSNSQCQVGWQRGDEPLHPQSIYENALSSIDHALTLLSSEPPPPSNAPEMAPKAPDESRKLSNLSKLLKSKSHR